MSRSMLLEEPAFRHDPAKATLAIRTGAEVDWGREPAVGAYRKLTVINKQSGGEIAVPVSASPAVVTGIGVIVASDDGRVRFFDQQLARVYWERRLDHAIYASLVVDPQRRTVIVASTAGLVTCFTLRGALVWSRALGYPVFATPAVSSRMDLLVVATYHSRCFGLRLGDGSLAFDVEVPKPWFAAHNGVAAHRDVYASPVMTDDGVIILCAGEHVVGLDRDGSTRWYRDLGVGLKASPVSVRHAGRVAVFTLDGACQLLATYDGSRVTVRHLGARIAASAALSGSIIAVGTQDGRAFGLDASSLDVRWSSPQGAPCSYTSFSVLPSGDFVATVANGDAMCLGRDDGAFRWQTSQVLGLPDHDPAMDTTPIASTDGRMYCASYAGDVYMFLFRPVAGVT